MRCIVALLLLIVSASQIEAKEFRYLARSPRALMMGDAFTAVSDDEYTLFYNPASLGRDMSMRLTAINPDFGVVNALKEQDRWEDFPSGDAAAISERIMGFPIYIHAGITPGLKFGNFGISMLANASSSIILRNAIHPFLDIDYRYDRGFVMGYGHSFKTSRGNTSLGLGVKHINRQGLKGSFSLFGTELLNKINESTSDINAIREALGYSEGSAWGLDVGAEHVMNMAAGSSLTMGISAMDLGDTRFKKESGTGDIPVQDMMINTGMAFRQKFMLLDYSLAMDLRPVNEPIPFSRMLHLGFEVGIPTLRLMAGLGEGYISYGLGLHLWLLKLSVGFYGVELGQDFKEEEGSRAVIYLSLFDFSFDV